MKRKTVLFVMPIFLFVTLVATACGGSSDDGGVASANGDKVPSSSTGPAKGKLDPKDALLKYARCMRGKGINMDDKGNASYDSQEIFEKARGACKKWEEASSEYRDPLDPKAMDAKTKYAQCMRKQGQDVKDPNPKDGSYQVPANAGQEFYQAMLKCKHLLPNRG